MTVCPRGLAGVNVSDSRKSAVAEALPPMAEMWDEWSKTLSLSFDPNDTPANYSWSGDPSPAVHALMNQVWSESKYIFTQYGNSGSRS